MLFKAIGKYAKPSNGEERGQQAFMAMNLLLLASPASLNPRRWKQIKRFARVEGRASVIPSSKDVGQMYEISKDAANANKVAQKGLTYSPQIEFTRGPYKAITRPSLDKNTWYHRFEIDGARANGQFQTSDAQKSLMLMIHNAGRSLIYLHSQIFLEQSGALRTSVGNGSGFQLNLWF